MAAATIFYFSATGNSLAVARAIASRLGDTKLVPMAGEIGSSPSADTQVVGLVFPVYIFGLPLIVSRFIERLGVPKDAYIFAVAAHGGMPCSTLTQAAKLFAQRNMKLSSGFSVAMVDNYTPFGGAPSSEKQKTKFDKAAAKINELCAAIERKDAGVYKGWPLVNWLFSGWMYRRAVPKIPGLDKNFSIDPTCNGCGVCGRVCPVANIEMADNRPVWRHRCEQCFACLHWCPKVAIQYGKNTAGKARYHHPDVTMADITVRSAAK